MKKYTFNSAVLGYHVYKDVWKPAIGEKLHAEKELDDIPKKFKNYLLNPFTPKSDFVDFTLSITRQFYSSIGDPYGSEGLKVLLHCSAINRPF